MNRRSFLTMLGLSAAASALSLPDVLVYDPGVFLNPGIEPTFGLGELTRRMLEEFERHLDIGFQMRNSKPRIIGESVKVDGRSLFVTDQFNIQSAFRHHEMPTRERLLPEAKVLANRVNSMKRNIVFVPLPLMIYDHPSVVITSKRASMRCVMDMWSDCLRFDVLMARA